MTLRLALLVLFMVSCISSAPQKKAAADGSFKMIILHNNDMHARFEQTGVLSDKCTKTDAELNKCYGGFARVAHEVREYRRRADAGEIPKVLYLNAGDTYTGTPWFSLYKDKIASDFLKILKPDAISLGNHEFDEGTANLADFLNEIDFPVLAANLDIELEPQLKTDMLMPSKVFDVDGRKVGIIGYLTPETKLVAAGNNVEFIDEVLALNQEADKLKADGVNIIIALGHSGLERDKEIAAACPEIDLVIGGHSHTFLYSGPVPDREASEGEYPTTVTQTSGKKVPVVQAYAFTKYLGYIHLEFDDEGDLIEIDGTPILLDGSITRDQDVLDLLEIYRPGVAALEEEIVGITRVLLDGSCRQRECNLGNFLTDSMVDWYALKYISSEFWTDASIGLLQGGGIRASINHQSNNGNITMEDAATVLPFESKIVTIEITGKSLLEALEHSVYRYEGGEFLQMSGIQVSYDMNRPTGARVVDAKVLCAKCMIPELENIDESKLYKIVTQDFLANGGDGYEMFKESTVDTFDILDIDVFVEYLKKKSPIYPAVEWRITIKKLLDPSEDVVGNSLVLLDSNCKQSECNLGNFITDSMVDWHALKYNENEYWTDASIAVIQGSKIKASIDANTNNGMILRSEVEQIFQPAFLNLNLITLTGDELRKMLEHSVSNYENANNVEFLQMSGIQVEYDLNKPVGQRVTDIKVLCAQCSVPELEALKIDGEYNVIMQSILASGADNYSTVFGTKLLRDLEETDVNVFMAYLTKKSPVHPAVEWRITIKALIVPSEDVVGNSLVLLDSNCKQSECNLGNFITDSMVDWHALKYNENEYWTDASIAVIQGSRIKASIDAKTNNGTILRSEAVKVFQPAYFNLNLVTLTGDELRKLLEHSVSNYENANNVEFLQMSGIQVEYDLNEPIGQRATDIKVLCAQCSVPELEALKIDGEYNVIMQSILASGADGFGVVFGPKLLRDLEESDVNVFMEYLSKKSPVHPAVEWRITITPENLDDTTSTSTPSTTTLSTSTSSISTPSTSSEAVSSTTVLQTTTLSGSNLKVSFVLVLLTTVVSLSVRR